MFRYAFGVSVLLPIVCLCSALNASESRFAQTGSRSQYTHWIDLYDANQRRIDPTDPKAPPYSPRRTCGRCHDYEAISLGHHFNAVQKSAEPGRPGEPWMWTDTRTGTQIPLSYRRWPGTYHPGDLGISSWDFVMKFGRHLPGGGPGEEASPSEQPRDQGPDAKKASPEQSAAKEPVAKETPAKEAPAAASKPAAASPAPDNPGRWQLSGKLEIDCMICHCNNHEYSMELWSKQIEDQNFAWAPTVALGLGFVEGKVSSLPDDFDPAKVEENARNKLPTTTYAPDRINPEKKVFFDVIRKTSDNICYYCHTTRLVGKDVPPDWTCDEDVHLRAGLTCADCHRNGIEHHTVRGFEGEDHPTGQSVMTLSCRGCHMNGADGGRLGAPQPQHKGLPVVHFEKLACTACHSGPRPAQQAFRVQTALAHGLGLSSHDYADDLVPGVVEPVFQRDGGMLFPYRMTWPAFWGSLSKGEVTPLDPDDAYAALRSTLRVRKGQTLKEALLLDVKLSKDEKKVILGEPRSGVAEADLTEEEKAKLTERINQKALDEFQTKLAKALGELKTIVKQPGAEPVYVAGGKAYRLAAEFKVDAFENDAAKPYAWKLGHDVRPARASIGATGCFDCHQAGTPIFEGQVTAVSPVLDSQPRTHVMYELAGLDKTRLDAWNQSFQGRAAFKWMGFASMGIVSLVLLWYAMRGVAGVAGMAGRKS